MPQKTINLYGLTWPAPEGRNWYVHELVDIELFCIRHGGEWNHKGKKVGGGMFAHYKRLQQLLWPWKKWHRWNDLLLKEFLKGGFLGIAGCSSSGKTHEMSCYSLCTYWAFPTETTVICSTTTREDLENRVWGEVKKLFKMARERCPDLPGHLMDSKQAIITDGKEVEGRDFRNGIKGVACKKGGQWEGISSYVGIKNKRVIMIADECHLMPRGHFDAASNLRVNKGFQLIASGNPNDASGAFGEICEPENGWDSHIQADKTEIWKTRRLNGRCIRLDGEDSPNMDYPDGEEPFEYLVNRKYLNDLASDYGKESWNYLMFGRAKFQTQALARRVITKVMCEKYHAMEEVIWGSDKITKIFAMDAAYGSVGGDRCVGGELQFGYNTEGKQMISLIGKPIIIPVSAEAGTPPEEQIVLFVKSYCDNHGIKPDNVFYDGTGRASLTINFAKLWSASVNPVEFGGRATERPDPDNIKKTCQESYANFVSELWMVCRAAIMNEQVRGMTPDLVHEGTMRSWDIKKSNKVQIEPKEETKLRLGRSPDLFDMFVVGIEGARRRGFGLGKIDNPTRPNSGQTLLKDLLRRQKELQKSHELSYAT